MVTTVITLTVSESIVTTVITCTVRTVTVTTMITLAVWRRCHLLYRSWHFYSLNHFKVEFVTNNYALHFAGVKKCVVYFFYLLCVSAIPFTIYYFETLSDILKIFDVIIIITLIKISSAVCINEFRIRRMRST